MVRPWACIRQLLAAWACLLVALSPLHAADRPDQGSGRRKTAVKLPKPEYSRVRAFNIPFESGEQGQGAADDFKPELWESLDLGDTWDRVETPPTKDKFLYRSNRDGEYWFAIRERNVKSSQLRPASDPTVELRVIVDIRPPELELTARQDPGGQVVVHWKMRDDHLDLRAFELEYQALIGDSKRWIPIKTETSTPDADGWHSGETVQFVPDHPTAIVLRAVAVDRAGNETVKSTAATLERVAARPRDDLDDVAIPSPNGRSGWNKADARERSPQETREKSRPRRPDVSQFPSESASDAEDPRRESDDPPSMPNRFPQSKRPDRRSPVDRPSDDDRETLPEPDGDAERESPPNRPVHETKKKEPALKPAPPKNRGDRKTEKRRPESPPAAMQATYPQTEFPADEIEEIPIGKPESAAPSRERRHDSDRPEELAGPAKRERDPARTPRKVLLPGGVEPRRVNFTRFRLEYQVDQVGPSGVKEVELWWTRDGGKSWDSFGVDDDNQSPVMVHVNEEGTYGFTLVVRNGSGLKGHVPRPGDMAEFWVVVDLSQPEARLISAEPGAGVQSGALAIRWEAEDNQLADRPIALSYSDSPDGPWSPIAAGLDNSGSYPWAIDEDVPDDVYIRLEVRDAAGNVGTSISETPVPTTQARPEAPILDVRPAPENGQSRRVYNLR